MITFFVLFDEEFAVAAAAGGFLFFLSGIFGIYFNSFGDRAAVIGIWTIC